jgi:serine/threonine-protein kinase
LSCEIGSTLGDYRLIKSIGSGAFGEVFQAEHLLTRRVDAIKLLARRQPGPGEDEQSILREIEIQASLQHPNIAAVYNAFRVPEGLALVMELIEGEPLSAILDRDGVPLCDGTRYVLVTLDALHYAHERRVVHRDVKPSNIVITPQGSVKLTDFGLARSLDEGQPTSSGIPAGSPHYMSPEQVVGNPADARSDCYSVGVILYELATGRKPFQGDTAFEIMLQHREAAPPPPISIQPRIGADLDVVILKALEKDPAHRFQSAAEFRRSLELALATCPALQPNGSAPPRTKRSVVRLMSAAAVVAGLALSSALLVPAFHRKTVAAAPVSLVPLAPPPVAPAPAPQAIPDPPAEAVPEPPVEAPPAVRLSHAAGKPPTRKPAVSQQPRTDAAMAKQLSIHGEPEPQAQSEAAPTDLPAAPALPPVVIPPTDPAVQQVIGEPAAPASPPTQPAKRPGLLKRAFGRIAHTFSTPKKD